MFNRYLAKLLTVSGCWLFASCLLADEAASQKTPQERLAEARAFALEAPEINTNPGLQYDDENRDFNMVIGMDRTPKGRIWGCWVGGGDSELACFICATSDDNGKTWSKPRLVIESVKSPSGLLRRALVGNFWTDPTGKLWLFFDQSCGVFDGRAGAWAITCENPDDEKPVWSEPRRIWHGATLNKPIVLKNGEWLMPISLWQRNYIWLTTEKHRPTMFPKELAKDYAKQFAELDADRMGHVFASKDQGQTWERRGGVQFPHFDFDEQMFVELNDGRLWMLARTRDGIYESYSSDYGQTWSKPKKRFEQNPARFFIRRLASGNLLFIKYGKINERTKSRSHLTAFLSTDDGKTWTDGLLLDERNAVSYPDGFQAPDGSISILYDRERYGAAEILMTRFREEDLVAGKFISADALQKHLVSKATAKHKKN